MKLKILSWNIWCGTYLEEVIELLKDVDADIIALQEVCKDGRGNLTEVIGKRLGYEYTDAIGMDLPVRFIPGYSMDDKRIIKFGPAILSKHKIVKSEVIKLTAEDKRLIIKTDMEVGGKILHVFSVHLKHTHQQQTELQNLQAENLVKLLPREKTIIMGDFNALPESFVVKKMAETFKEGGANLTSPTWSVYKEGCNVCLVNNIKHKLDYIFVSKDVNINAYNTIQTKSSDHLPIVADIEF